MELWQLYIFLAIIFWAVGQIFIRKGFASASAVDTFFMGGVWGLLVYLPYIILHADELSISLDLLIISGLIIASYLVYYKALSIGNFSINSTITSSYSLVTLMLAQIFLNEPLLLYQWVGIMMVITGIMVLSSFHEQKIDWRNWREFHLLWPIVAALYLGSGDFLAKFISENYSYASLFFGFGFMQLFLGMVFKLKQDGGRLNLVIFKRPYTVTGNFFLSVGTLFFYLSLFSGWASIVVPVSGSFLILVLIMARLFLHEKLTVVQYLFIALIILGNLLLNLQL